MRNRWFIAGLVGFLAVTSSALGHELECEKTVNGETLLVVDSFPAKLTYELVVRNIAPDLPSDVLGAEDPLLESLGFEGFDTPFTLPVDGEVRKTFDVQLRDVKACLAMAKLDGSDDSAIDNSFTVRWDSGSAVCSARVECVGEGGGSRPGPRMTGGGSVFRQDGQRITHGFQLRCDANDPRQSLEVNWNGNHFHLLDLTSAECKDTDLDERPPSAGFDTFIGTGVGKYNGVDGATIQFTFTDDGEPGINDTAQMVIHDAAGNVVLSVEGKLRFGNHQAHRN